MNQVQLNCPEGALLGPSCVLMCLTVLKYLYLFTSPTLTLKKIFFLINEIQIYEPVWLCVFHV